MNSGELDIIQRFPAWEFFCTLTFSGKVPGPSRREGLAVTFFCRVAKVVGIPVSSIVWVLRDELGEINGRQHFHCLLGRTSLLLTQTGIAKLKWCWEARGVGHADVRLYDKSKHGAAYVVDCLTNLQSAKNAYELSKFDRVETPPIMSKSLLQFVARQEASGRNQLRRPHVPCYRSTMVKAPVARELGSVEIGNPQRSGLVLDGKRPDKTKSLCGDVRPFPDLFMDRPF